MELDKSCTYTEWHFHYSRDGDTFTFYKTRYRRPNWWPKNISSPGYEETMELATAFFGLQQRYTVGHFWIRKGLNSIEWNKEINFIDKKHVLDKLHFIKKYEI